MIKQRLFQNMLWRALILVCAAKCMVQATMTLSPEFNDVLENSTLELTCNAPKNARSIKWSVTTQTEKYSNVVFSKEGACSTKDFLADNHYFEIECYSNSTFKMKIKQVNTSNHYQNWTCIHLFSRSNTALIFVQVPTKYVRFKNIDGDVLRAVLKTVEKLKTTIYCETSEGRPAANITWTKVSKQGKITDITHDKAYAVSRQETLTERNMIIVRSSIDIEPVREDNDIRFICEATNRKSYVAKKEIAIYVQFPPSKPFLTWAGEGNHSVDGTLYAIQNDTVTIFCHSYGEPAPHYKWKGHSEGAKLHIASIQTSTIKTCKASNLMQETYGEERACSSSTAVSIIVSYPPGTPNLVFDGHSEVVKNGQILRSKLRIRERSTFTITCKADGFPPPLITWKNQDDRNSPYLTFKSITKNSKGVYTCVAENVIKRSFPAYRDKRTESTDLKIDVLYQSKIEMFYIIGNENKKIAEVVENETILFNCSVDSNPESEIVLFFSGKELRRNVSTKTLFHSHRMNSCLDNGVYRCVAKNKYNSKPSSNELRLTVRCTPLKSPDFDTETNVSSAENVTITFRFKAIAYPTPTFYWFKLSGSYWNSLNRCNKYKIETVDNYSNLTVIGITEMDYGMYKLRIQNDVGSLEQLYFLKANGKPDPPTMFQHLNEYVKETSAILQWIPGFDGGPEQTFILRYKLYLGSEWVNVSIPHDGCKTMNYTLNGLESGSVYHTEIFAENTEGKSITLKLTFKTKDFPTLIEKSLPEWMYVIYSCGGVIVIVAVFVVTWFSIKRLKHRSPDRVIYQNVAFRAHELVNFYENLPCHTQTAAANVEHVFPTREQAVHECYEMTEILQENNLVSVPQNQQESNLVSVPQNQQDLVLELEEPFSEPTEYYNTLEIINRLEKINVSELYDYVKDRTDESFRADFQKIPNALQVPCSFARKPENIALNRYRAILPYDHTRVCIEGQPDFYINASYIDGYKRPRAYIACLGPTATTHDNFKTFWKMVWHERSELIVMVTNLNEPSGMKCEQYWPDPSQDEMYGDILVSCQKIETFAEYTIRSFDVTKTTNAEKYCRHLLHLQYTAWPDKKTPGDVSNLLEFRHKYKDIRKTVNGPVIIHCSAGIGGTGVFIAIDRLLQQGKNEGSVNVVACITKMREQRVRMVQTSEQFKFIFKVVAYALIFDCNPLQIDIIKEHIAKFDKKSFIRKYKELELSLEKKSKEQIDSIAKNMSNKDKNRQGADIPDDNNRVYLTLNRSFGDSDYINAVFIDSHKCKDHFIMAQSPLAGKESDFLTLIYQENCFCVVSMENFTECGMKIGKYVLNEKEPLNVGDIKISCFLYESKPQYIVRKVTIKTKEEFSTEQYFYHFQYKKWSGNNHTPTRTEDFVEFVKDVQKYEKLGEESSHVLVHCLKANERSGIFCAVAIMIEKLLHDGHVSVLNILRHLRTRRSSAITCMEQLKFCYKAAVVIAQRQNEAIYVNQSLMI